MPALRNQWMLTHPSELSLTVFRLETMIVRMDIYSAVAKANSIAETLRLMNRAQVGSNYNWIKNQIKTLSIDCSHWTRKPRGQGCSVADLKIKSSVQTGHVKRLILRNKLINYECEECHIGPVWQGKNLVLRLDHRNGVRDDHRIENLHFLCPNCDSQTSTFCGRNKPKNLSVQYEIYCDCGVVISHKSVRCKSCANHNRRGRSYRIEWPLLSDLVNEVKETSLAAVGRRLGVSEQCC